MICKSVYHGRIGTNYNSTKDRILIQVENNVNENFCQARASLTIEEAKQLVKDLENLIKDALTYKQ